VDTFLFEAAEPGPVVEPQPYADRRTGMMGVVFPDNGISGGQIMESGYAIKLGAALIRAGRQVDAFIDIVLSRHETHG